MAEKKKKRGRPPKITKKIKEILFEGLELGMSYELASWRAGITDKTRQNWVNRGEAIYEQLEATEEDTELESDDHEYLLFFLEHQMAIAESQITHLVIIENSKDPKLSLQMLERRFPATFGPPAQRQQITGHDGRPLQIEDVTEYTPEQKAARIAAIFAVAKERKNDTADEEED